MYNRYIPGTNGIYERHSVCEKKPEEVPKVSIMPETSISAAEPKQGPIPQAVNNHQPDLGDLLLLCIILLLLVDCEQDEMLSILITAAAFLFLQ